MNSQTRSERKALVSPSESVLEPGEPTRLWRTEPAQICPARSEHTPLNQLYLNTTSTRSSCDTGITWPTVSLEYCDVMWTLPIIFILSDSFQAPLTIMEWQLIYSGICSCTLSSCPHLPRYFYITYFYLLKDVSVCISVHTSVWKHILSTRHFKYTNSFPDTHFNQYLSVKIKT